MEISILELIALKEYYSRLCGSGGCRSVKQTEAIQNVEKLGKIINERTEKIIKNEKI